jgi:hypothetical protein
MAATLSPPFFGFDFLSPFEFRRAYGCQAQKKTRWPRASKKYELRIKKAGLDGNVRIFSTFIYVVS